MKRSGVFFCATMVGMLLAGAAHGKGPNPPPQPHLGDPKTAICRYTQGPAMVTFMGRKVPMLTMQQMPLGKNITLALWTTEEGGKTPMWFEELVKKSKPGDVYEVNYAVATEGKQPVLDRMTEYELKPGEDEPNVFIFEKIKDEKTGAFTVSKFRTDAEFMLPQARVAGKMAPREDLLKLLQGLKSGRTIEIQFVQNKIKSIKKYEAPKWAKFTKLTTQEVDGKNLKAVEVDAYGNNLTLVIAQKDSALAGKFRSLKEGAPIIYKSTKDDKGTIWLNTVTIPPKGAQIPPESANDDSDDDDKKPDDKKPDKKKTE
jgi:hypothetical protein